MRTSSGSLRPLAESPFRAASWLAPGRRRRRPGAVQADWTRTQLLEAALACFAAKGYAATGLRWIGAEAGVNPALVSYHFGGKAGLYRETLRTVMADRIARLAGLVPVLPSGPGQSREAILRGLREYLLAYAEQLLGGDWTDPREASVWRLVAREVESPSPECETVLLDLVQPLVDYLDACIRALGPALDPERRLAVILGLQGPMLYLRYHLGLLRLLRRRPVAPQDLPALLEGTVDFMLDGLRVATAGDLEEGEPAGAGLPMLGT